MDERITLSLYDRYAGWLRAATTEDDVDYVMECVSDDAYNGALSTEEAAQLRELAENVTDTLLGRKEVS